MTPGLTPVDQAPASAVTISIEDRTVTDLWQELFTYQSVRETFIQSLRGSCRGKSRLEVYDDLADADVPYQLIPRVAGVARGDRREAWRLVSRASGSVRWLGQRGHTTVDDLLATASLFEAPNTAPTLAFVLDDQEFSQCRRDQREAVLALIATLSRTFDVRLVTSRVTRLWLREHHRADLPGVSNWCSAGRDSGHIQEALEQLDRDGREVRLVRSLREDTGEALSYTEVYAASTASPSRVRQCINRLADLGLVETFGPASDRMVTLLDAGREFLECVDEQIARQRTLDGRVREPPKDARQCRVSQTEQEGGGTAGPYRTGWMDRARHTAVRSCSSDGTVTVAGAPIEASPQARFVSYNAERDEAVVSVAGKTPVQYTVSLATALASPRFLDKALPVDRLDKLLDDVPPAILREARCIGGLSAEAIEDSQCLRDTLVEWGEDLEDMTTDLQREEYANRNRFRGEIVRSAHGLAGSIVHLLDAAGVDLSREVRVPGDLNTEKLSAVADSLAVSAAIQSRYESFAVYRQLFEQRERKRQSAFSPDIDAQEPTGSLIGSIVVRGVGVDRKQTALRDALSSPADVHEDAPEIAVTVPVEQVDRDAYALVASRTLKAKNLRVTRVAVSILQAFAGTPYDAAEALSRLGVEDCRREVRMDDLRYALSTLQADQLFPDMAPSVGQIVKTLLEATEPLSPSTLADRAGVSTQSLRNHKDNLVGLDLVRITDAGWRLALSFDTPEEWDSPVHPNIVDERLTEAVDALLVQCLPPEEYANPEHPAGGVLFYPPDPWGLLDTDGFEAWVRVAGALTDTEQPQDCLTVSFGPEVAQTPISSPGRPAIAD